MDELGTGEGHPKAILARGASQDPAGMGRAGPGSATDGEYLFYPPDRKARDDDATRWRMQLGARYAF